MAQRCHGCEFLEFYSTTGRCIDLHCTKLSIMATFVIGRKPKPNSLYHPISTLMGWDCYQIQQLGLSQIDRHQPTRTKFNVIFNTKRKEHWKMRLRDRNGTCHLLLLLFVESWVFKFNRFLCIFNLSLTWRKFIAIIASDHELEFFSRNCFYFIVKDGLPSTFTLGKINKLMIIKNCYCYRYCYCYIYCYY